MSLLLHIFSSVLLPLVLVAGLGYILGRHGRVDPKPLATVTFYLFNPALVFFALANSAISPNLLGRLVLLKLLVYVGMVPLASLLAARLKLSPALGSAFLMGVAFANSGNYGLSVNEYAFGSAGLALAVICYVTDNLAVNSLGVYVAARGHTSAGHALKQVLLNPALYAMPLGILASQLGWALPLSLQRPLELLSRAAVPTMLVILGMQLAQLPIARRDWGLIGLASALRLLVAPVLAYALTVPLGLAGLPRQVAVVETAVPTAVMSSIIAQRYDAEPNLVAGTVLVSSVVSLLTMTVLLTLML